jgi:hypothetical protein
VVRNSGLSPVLTERLKPTDPRGPLILFSISLIRALVGATYKMLRGLTPIASILSATGPRAASVFPLAGGETPTAFFPFMRGGIKADCIGVILPKLPKKGP